MVQKPDNKFFQNQPILMSHEFFMDKCINAAIDAPLKAIETGKMADGYATIRLCAYFCRQFAWAGKLLEKSDADALKVFLDEQRAAIKADGVEDDQMIKVMLAVAMIAFIQRAYNMNKPSMEEYRI